MIVYNQLKKHEFGKGCDGMKKKNDYESRPSNFLLFIAAVSFAVLNIVALKTGIRLFSYLSAIPFIFIIIAVFDRILQ